jgi:hypothetical protein
MLVGGTQLEIVPLNMGHGAVAKTHVRKWSLPVRINELVLVGLIIKNHTFPKVSVSGSGLRTSRVQTTVYSESVSGGARVTASVSTSYLAYAYSRHTSINFQTLVHTLINTKAANNLT